MLVYLHPFAVSGEWHAVGHVHDVDQVVRVEEVLGEGAIGDQGDCPGQGAVRRLGAMVLWVRGGKQYTQLINPITYKKIRFFKNPILFFQGYDTLAKFKLYVLVHQ